MSRNIIACRPYSYAPFETKAFEHMASLGIKHVEIEVPKPEEVETTLATLAKWGLSASSLHGQCDVSQTDAAKHVEAQMPTFKAFGAKIMFVSCKAEQTPLDTVYGRLREAGAVAAAHGVTIVMETHPDLITNSTVALATMQGVNHPNVRINYDTANIYFYNDGVDGVAELQRIVSYVGAVHLKDTNGGFHAWNFPSLGHGVVRFAEIFQVLDAAGFTGPCTMEIEGIEGEKKTEELVLGRMVDSVALLKKLGRM